MTDELTKEIIVGVVSAFFTALFAGVPGAALFWWTYQRDQERLIVEKLRPRQLATEKGTTLEKEKIGPVYDILIRNRSLFSVHVGAVGFEIDGEVIRAEHPYYPVSRTRSVNEIPSQDSIQVSIINKEDRVRFTTAVYKASQRHNTSFEKILYGPKMIALVATETGKGFSSLPPWRRAYRWLLQVKREMDGQSTAD